MCEEPIFYTFQASNISVRKYQIQQKKTIQRHWNETDVILVLTIYTAKRITIVICKSAKFENHSMCALLKHICKNNQVLWIWYLCKVIFVNTIDRNCAKKAKTNFPTTGCHNYQVFFIQHKYILYHLFNNVVLCRKC